MDAKDLTLNIAVNLGRICRWTMEKKPARVQQFLTETEDYLRLLDSSPKNPRFEKTFQSFNRKFHILKNNVKQNDEWAEEMLTWANILTHRAKLA